MATSLTLCKEGTEGYTFMTFNGHPNYPVLLCDAKIVDLEAALRETMLYCAAALTTQSGSTV